MLTHNAAAAAATSLLQASSPPCSPRTSTCPEHSASLWSTLTFSWLNPTITKGYKTPLKPSDMWALAPPDRVETLEEGFRAHWQQQLKKRGPKHASLFATCCITVRGLILSALPFKLVNDASQFVGPVVLNLLLSSVASPSAPSGPPKSNFESNSYSGGEIPPRMQNPMSDMEQPGLHWNTTAAALVLNPSVLNPTRRLLGFSTQQSWAEPGAVGALLHQLLLLFTAEGQYQGYVYAVLLFLGLPLGFWQITSISSVWCEQGLG